jgi:hypothetical protein
MRHALLPTAIALLLTSSLAGCAHLDSPGADHAKTADLDKQRRMLSEGYSMLYEDAGKLDAAELILYVKAESPAVHEVVTAISDAGDRLKKDLERIARDYPGVRIDLDPLPEMEKRKRAAISKDRARYFAPVIGHGGREYERTVLIGFANGLNHESHLCQVMADAEPDAGLKKFLVDAGKRYDQLYDRVTALLEKEYFKDPDGKAGH